MLEQPTRSGDVLFARKRFVIVLKGEPGVIVDGFEAADWAPAILEYAKRLGMHAYPAGVALRQARTEELDGRPASWTDDPGINGPRASLA